MMDEHEIETTAHVIRCAATEELKQIRATLLVNLGDTKHNRFGIVLKDSGATHELMFKALDHLSGLAERLEKRLADVRARMEKIVCTDGEDRGMILVSSESRMHTETVDGRPVSVYDCENFFPLGDALIELHCMTNTPKAAGA